MESKEMTSRKLLKAPSASEQSQEAAQILPKSTKNYESSKLLVAHSKGTHKVHAKIIGYKVKEPETTLEQLMMKNVSHNIQD